MNSEEKKLLQILIAALVALVALVVWAAVMSKPITLIGTSAHMGKTLKFDIICIDNVEYFYKNGSHGFLTPHLNTSSKVYTCK